MYAHAYGEHGTFNIKKSAELLIQFISLCSPGKAWNIHEIRIYP